MRGYFIKTLENDFQYFIDFYRLENLIYEAICFNELPSFNSYAAADFHKLRAANSISQIPKTPPIPLKESFIEITKRF